MSLGDLTDLAARPFFLHLPGGEPTDFDVRSFSVTETLHEPWSLSVEFVLRGSLALDQAVLLGKTGRLEITSFQGPSRSFVGVITVFERGRLLDRHDGGDGGDGTAGDASKLAAELAVVTAGARGPEGLATFRVELASPLVKAALVTDFRIFEDKPLLDIVRAILAPYGVGLDTSALEKAYAAELPLRVAYRETHLAFLQRLLARAGVTFAAESTPQGESLRLYDGAPSLADVPFLPYVARDGLVPTEEQIFALRRDAKVNPAGVSLRGFHFLRPATPQEGQSGHLPARDTTTSGEIYDLEPQLQHDGQGPIMAQHRLQAAQWRGHFTYGQSTFSSLTPGRAWAVSSGGLLPFEGAYQAVSVVHRGVNPAWASSSQQVAGQGRAAATAVYENSFVAIPADLVCRPPVSRGPLIVGIQTAKVVGPAAEEIHTDQHGRIRLKFPWDRSPPVDDTTEGCWVRVGSSWAGKGWGALRLPRVGHEVVVHFEQGDPECPVILGSVYNGRNNPPAALPLASTESVLRSASSLGSEGFHEIRFDDANGVERFNVHAERDHDIEVLRDRKQTVRTDESTDVTRNRTRKIGQNQELAVAHSDGNSIGGDSVLEVRRNLVQVTATEHLTTVVGERAWKVSQDRLVTVAGAASRAVSKTLASDITGGLEAYLDGLQLTELDKNARRKVEGSSDRFVAQRYSQELGQSQNKIQSRTNGSLDVTIRGEHHRVALGSLTEGTGNDWTLSVKDGIVFSSKETRIEAETLTIRVGDKARLSISKSGEIALHGSKLFIDGKKTTLKGSKTNKVSGESVSNPKPQADKEKKTEPFDFEIGVHLKDGIAVSGVYRIVSDDGKIDKVGSQKEERPGLAIFVFKGIDPFNTYSLFHKDNGVEEAVFEGIAGNVLAARRRTRPPRHENPIVELAAIEVVAAPAEYEGEQDSQEDQGA